MLGGAPKAHGILLVEWVPVPFARPSFPARSPEYNANGTASLQALLFFTLGQFSRAKYWNQSSF
jgi:hypothetical protein